MRIKNNPSISKKVLGIFSLLFMNSALATAQNEIGARITRYEVKKEFQEKFKNTVAAYVQKSILSDKNIMSEAYLEQENQAVIWLFERWINQNELEKFGKNFKEINDLAKTALLVPQKVIEVKDLEPLTKEQWRKTSRKGEEQLTIMLFVDAKKGTEDNFMKVYHKAMPEFRSESGVVTYQLSQLKEDPTQFVTFEKFRNKEAFQYHLNFPPIQPVIDFLNSSIKKQPFQDGIHNLIEFAPLIRE
ncbi:MULTISPECIES: putative quinol monooxygenase [Flavobacterium]|uniref:putative quinol monooxygenase n=1 Tax=Flavobacterium TaxID=237 RepID=UPI0011845D49|nr:MULTISPECIES: antibiotic biosynthesis monooxygenase [Flavobacterium]MCR4029774.1 antibiotic biosynthesis monooxygenase [Flavobacterium panacis]